MDQCEVLSECVIKIENVKQEPDNQGEEETCNFTEGDVFFAYESEVKEEGEEEEIKPPVRLFLNPEEVPEEEQEHEQDPLALCNENNFGKSTWFIGREHSYSKEGDEQGAFSRGRGVLRPPALRKDLSHMSLRNNSTNGDERSVCTESLSESGHEERITREQEDCHKCSHCQRSFKRRRNLITHIQTYRGKCSLECLVCEKNFCHRKTLMRHMQIHSGQRPHECSVCQKSFTQGTHLVMHMRIHSGERPHECSFCPKTFIRKGDLVVHTRIHSGERPYECSVCKKCFARRGNLQTHVWIHIREKSAIRNRIHSRDVSSKRRYSTTGCKPFAV